MDTWTHQYLSGAVSKTYQVWWPIGKDGEREPKESVLSAHLDDEIKVAAHLKFVF